jgi:hypothetical protein
MKKQDTVIITEEQIKSELKILNEEINDLNYELLMRQKKTWALNDLLFDLKRDKSFNLSLQNRII